MVVARLWGNNNLSLRVVNVTQKINKFAIVSHMLQKERPMLEYESMRSQSIKHWDRRGGGATMTRGLLNIFMLM